MKGEDEGETARPTAYVAGAWHDSDVVEGYTNEWCEYAFAEYEDGMACEADAGLDLWRQESDRVPAESSGSGLDCLTIWSADFASTQITALAAAQDDGHEVEDACLEWLQDHIVAMFKGSSFPARGEGKGKSSEREWIRRLCMSSATAAVVTAFAAAASPHSECFHRVFLQAKAQADRVNAFPVDASGHSCVKPA